MGKDGMVHLASPATAAFTAIKGEITEPSLEICERALKDCFAAVASGAQAVQPTRWKNRPYEKPDYKKLLSIVGEKTTESSFSGTPFYLQADNVDTDQIIPAKYLTETEKEIFGQHCLEDAPIASNDRLKLSRSQILVAGENFGCGSSREHAPWALSAAGIKCVIARSFARIFYNNMLANGLLCIEVTKETIAKLHGVIACGNEHGDILSDGAAAALGSMGMMCSSAINPDTGAAMFESGAGTAPTLAGQNKANPLGRILTAAMMLRHIGAINGADAIESAVNKVLRDGYRTADLFSNIDDPAKLLGTSAMGEMVLTYI